MITSDAAGGRPSTSSLEEECVVGAAAADKHHIRKSIGFLRVRPAIVVVVVAMDVAVLAVVVVAAAVAVALAVAVFVLDVLSLYCSTNTYLIGHTHAPHTQQGGLLLLSKMTTRDNFWPAMCVCVGLRTTLAGCAQLLLTRNCCCCCSCYCMQSLPVPVMAVIVYKRHTHVCVLQR